MVKLPPQVKDVISKQVPLPIATADDTGKPNVVFVTMWKFIDDETLMIVDNFLNKTLANIKMNPRMALVAYDSESKKSYQVKGSIDYQVQGDNYNQAKAMAESKKVPGKAAVIFNIEEVYEALYGPDAGKKIA